MFQRVDSNAASQSSIASAAAGTTPLLLAYPLFISPLIMMHVVGPPTTDDERGLLCCRRTNARPHTCCSPPQFSSRPRKHGPHAPRCGRPLRMSHHGFSLTLTFHRQAPLAVEAAGGPLQAGGGAFLSVHKTKRTALHSLAAARSEAPRPPSLLGQGTGRGAEYVRACRRAPRDLDGGGGARVDWGLAIMHNHGSVQATGLADGYGGRPKAAVAAARRRAASKGRRLSLAA